MIDCRKCKYLINNSDEYLLLDKVITHRCGIYNRQLRHKDMTSNIKHGFIFPCIECRGKDYEPK